MKDYSLILRKNIKKFRREKGLTQEELAKILNGRKSLVSNYENGYSVPDIFTCIVLANFFAISIDELVGRLNGQEREL